MESGFIGGSENLYKYLVTIGLLLIVGTIYYPLKEKQSLELLNITLNNEVRSLTVKIEENKKKIDQLEKNKQNFETELKEREKVNQENKLIQIETEKKYEEVVNRERYISIYNILFWIFLPIGVALCVFGFIKWHKAKKCDDEIQNLERQKLELEVQKLRSERGGQTP